MPRFVIEREIPHADRLSPEELRTISQRSCSVLNQMRRMLAVLLLGVAVAFTAAPALADGSKGNKIFYGDGYDDTTCADLPPCATK